MRIPRHLGLPPDVFESQRVTLKPFNTDNRSGDDDVDSAGTAARPEPDPGSFWTLGVIALAQLMVVLDASASNLVNRVGHQRPSNAFAEAALVTRYHRVFSISAVMLLGASIACLSLVGQIRRHSLRTEQVLEPALTN